MVKDFEARIPYRKDVNGYNITHLDVSCSLEVEDGQFVGFIDTYWIEVLDKGEKLHPISIDLGDLPLSVIEDICAAVVNYDWHEVVYQYYEDLKEDRYP